MKPRLPGLHRFGWKILSPLNLYLTKKSLSGFKHASPRNYAFPNLEVMAVLPIHIPDTPNMIPLEGVTMISLSTHRDAYPAVGFGNRGVQGFTRGHRTVAGTLTFDLILEEPFANLIRLYREWLGDGRSVKSILPDELFRFDLIVNFTDVKLSGDQWGVTRWGEFSNMFLEDVRILDSSFTLSIDSVKPTAAYSFMCRNISSLVLDDPTYGDGRIFDPLARSKPTISSWTPLGEPVQLPIVQPSDVWLGVKTPPTVA